MDHQTRDRATTRCIGERAERIRAIAISFLIATKLISCSSGFLRKAASWLGVVRNVDKALRFAELWNTHLKERRDRFEVVEVTDENTRCESNGTFIGYDLSAGYNNSLLRSGLKSIAGANRVAEPIEELLDLINRHYAPQLNGQGLFQTWEVASVCLRAMTALQDLSPNLFEGGDLREFLPVGLYRISVDRA